MNFKRFIFNRLFNKRQREIIWRAVLYSEHTYKRRGNVDAAAEVRLVINETAKTAATKQRIFSEGQVQEIVQAELDAYKRKVEHAVKNYHSAVKEAYNNGKTDGYNKAAKDIMPHLNKKLKEIFGFDPSEVEGVKFVKGMQIDLQKCAKCPHKDECIIKSAIEEVELEEAEKNKENNADNGEEKNGEREIPVCGKDSESSEETGSDGHSESSEESEDKKDSDINE